MTAVPPAPPAALRTLSVCADDFGQSPGISEGIARLARAGRLTAVSCMSNGVHWGAGAKLLAGLGPTVMLGLHINLTEGRPRSPQLAKLWPHLPALPVLLARAHLGQLPHTALRAEVRAQLEAFQNATGAPPAFVDGHQHVHQLPGLRRIVLDMASHIRPQPAVRNTLLAPASGFAFKRWVITHTGGRALARELARRKLARNAALLGVHDFRPHAHDYRVLVQGWLRAVPQEGGLLFCHPGMEMRGDAADPIAASRVRELAYLGSDAFTEDLASAGVRLGHVWQVATPAG